MKTILIALPIIFVTIIACVNVSTSGKPGFPSQHDLALRASRERMHREYDERFDTINLENGLLLIELFDFLLIDQDIISATLNDKAIFSQKQLNSDSYFEYLFIDKPSNNVLKLTALSTGDKFPATVGVKFPYHLTDTYLLKLDKGRPHYFVINCKNPLHKFNTLNNRILYLSDSLTVQNGSISLSVRDWAAIDYDTINIYLNDSLIVKNVQLNEYNKTYNIVLEPGSYVLSIQAVNEGYSPPNTTSLTIDGIEKNFGLISDQRISAAIKLQIQPDTLSIL